MTPSFTTGDHPGLERDREGGEGWGDKGETERGDKGERETERGDKGERNKVYFCYIQSCIWSTYKKHRTNKHTRLRGQNDTQE